ncbi:MAG: hypothetical protein FGM38_00665, partial [Solirubrobacterales bacterium]|nr:hypothetical protein [Solirubrobacterales bacterium]
MANVERQPIPITARAAVVGGLLFVLLLAGGVGSAYAAKKTGSFTIVTKGLGAVPKNRSIGIRVWQIGEMAKGQRRVRKTVQRQGKTVLKGLPLGAYQIRVP